MARRRLASPVLPFPEPVPPLDNDDLLREILLLLPPQPSSLLRASVVCNRWRRLVSDPGFLRRFRAHHRKPSLLGLFSFDGDEIYPFIPTLGPPDRIPAARFSLARRRRRESWHFVECRHGLALFLNRIRPEAVIWNPISGRWRRVTFPPEFGDARERDILCAAVLCAAGDDDDGHVHGDCDLNSFKLALARRGEQARTLVFACLYESKSGEWGNVISTTTTALFVWRKPSVLVGNALCWLLSGGGNEGDILELDFEMQKLVVIARPYIAGATASSDLWFVVVVMALVCLTVA
ncbi:uncharacterized protein LOC119309844 [Triticum dicoccoides]|uniref:uncharacterized protein LOC119309844 n=1 Tax=Triticum dicoccoides TaxID=85692 RepID=UPI001891AFB4|nr:uncharacterized protein LOC119309844 [Triticum dicoccoides]